MPRETEADRILRERLKQRGTQQSREQAEAERQAQIAYLRYLDEIHTETNTVLQLLAELNYPFMQEVRFRKEHNFILFELFDHSVTKAGWGIGSSETWVRDGYISHPIYLLSDGRLCCENSVGSPEKIIGLYVQYLIYLIEKEGEKGAGHDGEPTQNLHARVQAESRARKLAA